MNTEHYKDPTAEIAVGQVASEEKYLTMKANKLIRTLVCMVNLAGFEFTDRI